MGAVSSGPPLSQAWPPPGRCYLRRARKHCLFFSSRTGQCPSEPRPSGKRHLVHGAQAVGNLPPLAGAGSPVGAGMATPANESHWQQQQQLPPPSTPPCLRQGSCPRLHLAFPSDEPRLPAGLPKPLASTPCHLRQPQLPEHSLEPLSASGLSLPPTSTEHSRPRLRPCWEGRQVGGVLENKTAEDRSSSCNMGSPPSFPKGGAED